MVLFVGELKRVKGIYTLLEAINILKKSKKEVRLIIVGDGPEKKWIQDFVLKNNLQNIIRLDGRKSPSELLYYYNAADLFVMPSFSESFGLVYVEAMSCGTPVIGSHSTAIPEVISSDDYGILVPPGNATGLADAIEMGLKRKWNKNKIIKYAHSFSWDNRITDIEKIYLRIKNQHTS